MNSAVATALTAAQLGTLAESAFGANDYSPLSEQPFLLCDLTTATAPGETLTRWLRQVPAPVLGFGGNAASPLARACDVWLPDAEGIAALTAGIRHSPLAAGVLVQLLRMNESLRLDDALVAESLAYATLQAGSEFRAWLAGYRAEAAAVTNDDGPAVQITRENEHLHLSLNRAGNRNAMSVEMRDALCEALQLALADDSIHRIRLSARGKCFSTGGDLGEFGTAPDSATAHAVRMLTLPGRLLARCAERTVVEVHGACIGSGIEFPAFAGRIEARANAWFQLPELKYGLIPGAGGCVSVTRRIGRQRTAWMVLSGQRIDARTAKAWGLIDAIAERP